MKYNVVGQTHGEHLSFGVEREVDLELAMEIINTLKNKNPKDDYWYEECTDDL